MDHISEIKTTDVPNSVEDVQPDNGVPPPEFMQMHVAKNVDGDHLRIMCDYDPPRTTCLAMVTLANDDAYVAVYHRAVALPQEGDYAGDIYTRFHIDAIVSPEHFRQFGVEPVAYRNYAEGRYVMTIDFAHSSHDSDLDCMVQGCGHTNGRGSERSWLMRIATNSDDHYAHFALCPECIGE